MERTAAPGTIQITVQTYRLVAGYFDCEDLGLVGVKGITTRVRAYRVTGERRVQACIDVARERGFTRLVGREQELHLLCEGFARAKERYGQAISIIGDAGLGKSRLLYEFRQSLTDEEFTLLEGRCSPYRTAVAYLCLSLNCLSRTSRLTRVMRIPTSRPKSCETLRRLAPMSLP